MNIYQKLLEVRKSVPYLKKASQGHQYNYTGSSQVLSAVREKLDELGLVLITKVIDKNVLTETVENKDKYDNNKKTTTYFTELNLEFTWINAENPEETIVIPFYAQGVDIAGEKGVGKALTYGEKYFLLKQFNIATDKDDPDAFQQKVENYKPPKLITPEQIGELKTLALQFAKLRNQTEAAVYKVLGITDIEKLPEGMAHNHIGTLKAWIEKAEKESD
ncbi:ERF family protein [Halalkalibacterium ligniniphilum]|uniref:ERF family protein n=1 Tax=Halalkalibacterium ligniniphilum TaxID=1134413 RepID=UPI0003490A3D|nr:ERF family protein [Halalkalibacterium ligniniphilum]